MGMMDMMGGEQMPQQARMPQGGMMSGGGMPQQAPVDNSAYLQMADAILQDPSPQTVTQVIQQLTQMGGEGTQEVAAALQKVMNDPNQLVQMVMQIKQALMQS
jgi:hypothetical protein